MLKEFREFAARGNVIDLAVGVIIGAAFGKIVASLISDVVMPPIGMALGGVDFTNLFVALNDGKLVQPWVYLDGELSSVEGREATGFSFETNALTFDPGKVLSRIQVELPQAHADVFFVEGGEGGNVRYSVAVTSQQGGQLVVVVGPDGEVQSVVPN